MKNFVLAMLLAALAISSSILCAEEPSHRINLPTSKALTVPVPGYVGRTSSFPATVAVSPDGRYAAFLNQGYGTQESGARQSIAILDLSDNDLRDFPDDRLSDDYSTRQSYYIGLAFSSDGKRIYASMGSITDPAGEKPRSTGNGIAIYQFSGGKVTPERFVKIPAQKLAAEKEVPFALRTTPAGTATPYPAGFSVLPGKDGDRLLIANNLSDNVVLLDLASEKVLREFDVSQTGYVPAAYPYTAITNKAGTKAWVSLWNASAVAELDLEKSTLARVIKVSAPQPTEPGSHPTVMALDRKETTLYIALSNTTYVSAVDLTTGEVLRNFNVVATGAAPLAIALSTDESQLFVACGGFDGVAVFDLKRIDPAKHLFVGPTGWIPTEWYPSALAVIGDDLVVASAKGKGAGPNNMMGTLKGERRRKEHPYIPTLIGGSIQRISLADIAANLQRYTQRVHEDNLTFSDGGKIQFSGGASPIHHVIYILKENRTYDQILGDLPVGDGDKSLTMYGENVTPNEHKLALQFGVLDNFYDSGEVSGDGHIWSTAAITSDYNEKNWPIAYRSKERTYDADGTVSEEIVFEKGISDIDDPGTGFLWDNMAKQSKTFRIYGEFIHPTWCKSEKVSSPKQGTPSSSTGSCAVPEIKKGEALPANLGGGPSSWPWPVPQMKLTRPTKAALRGHFDPLYPDFQTDYPDQLRADEFLREFGQFVKARGTVQELPQFTLIYLPDDHTGGTRPGHPTPQASVADNDLALGRIVEGVSHSPYWEDTAIFVLEDDAQDGADHVDAHRSTAFVISKYSPRTPQPFVDHNFYTTVSFVHTMEYLLGARTMNLFDAHAPLTALLFSGPGTQPAYVADDRNLKNGLIYRMNEKKAAGAKESSLMDFSRPDAADNKKLNAILWRDAKGGTPMPQPGH